MEIVTERLVLREFAEGDLAPLLAYHADPCYAEFHGPDEAGPDRARELLRMFRRWAAQQPRLRFQLAIAPAQEPPELVGCGGVRRAGLGSGRAEFGIELAPRWWGHGYATESGRALLGFGFDHLRLAEIRGVSVTANTRFASMAGRLGFVVVGTRPGPAWMRTRGWTQTEWQLTRERWETLSAG